MPQLERYTNPLTYAAEAAITAHTVVVEGTDDGECNVPSGADVGSVIGVARHAADAGAQVIVDGPGSYVPVTASGAISRGAWVSIAGTSGKVKAATLTADTEIVGKAQTTVTTDGDLVYILVSPFRNDGA